MTNGCGERWSKGWRQGGRARERERSRWRGRDWTKSDSRKERGERHR